MKRFLALSLTIGFCLPRLCSAAQTAQVKMYSLSVVIPHSTDQHGHALDLSTVNNYNNGELPPDWAALDTGYTNSTWITFLSYDGILALDLPLGIDSDNNGIPDFFEADKALNAVPSVGAWDTLGPGPGSVSALWYRNADQPLSGGVDLRLRESASVSHNFFPFHQILEYTGTLTYTPAETNISGSIHLVLTGDSSKELNGPVLFTKISTNKYNLLSLAASTWTNEWGGELSVSNQVYSRDLTRLTNYSGYVRFYNYQVLYPEPEFTWWRMVISDTNDVDHDNIPDFSDDTSSGAPPRRPSFSLLRTTTNLLMTIRGDVGHLHQIQETIAINNPTWSNVLSVTLTNDPQNVALPSPSGGAKFWRLQAF